MQHITNHAMLLLDSKPQQQRQKSRFLYDSRWSKIPGCEESIQASWDQHVAGSRMFRFHCKVKNARAGLLAWRKKETTNSRKQIEDIKGLMDRMCEEGGQRDWRTWYTLKYQLDEAYKSEEEY